jgi:ligand-binding sensor domain-containing protein
MQKSHLIKLLVLLLLLACNQTISASNENLRIDKDMGAVMSLESDEGTLWIGTALGLFKWDNTNTGLPEHLDVDTGPVYVLELSNDTLWIGAKNGLFRLDKPRQGLLPQRIDLVTGPVIKLYKYEKKLLIGGNALVLWRDVAVGMPERLNLDVYPINVFHSDRAILWIGSEKGLLRWDCARNEAPVFTPEFKGMNVTSLSHYGNTLFVGTKKGLFRWYRVGASKPDQVLVDSPIYSLYQQGDSPLLISVEGKGLLRWDNTSEGEPRPADYPIVLSSKYYRNGSILWMGAGRGDGAGYSDGTVKGKTFLHVSPP